MLCMLMTLHWTLIHDIAQIWKELKEIACDIREIKGKRLVEIESKAERSIKPERQN